MMTSRVVPYRVPLNPEERFVMVFSQYGYQRKHSVNEMATKLLKEALEPIHLNTPYQGWKCEGDAMKLIQKRIDKIYGKVIFVREQKIDGRWQLVSMSEDLNVTPKPGSVS